MYYWQLELYLNFPEFKVVTQYNSPNSLVQEHYVQRATRTVGDAVEALDNHVREIRTFHDIKAWKFETIVTLNLNKKFTHCDFW